MKVRAILDYKGVPYERVTPLGSTMLKLRRRGKTGKVPAVEIDGELIVDSTDIAYAIDEKFPDPPLLPTDARERGLCHALEDWADESLYFIGLYYRWFEAEGRKAVPAAFGNSVSGLILYRDNLPMRPAQIRGQRTLRKSPEHVRRDLERHLDAIEGMLASRLYLLGDRPYLCDLALWGQLNYLNRTPVGGQAIKPRQAIGSYIVRMTPESGGQERLSASASVPSE